MKANTPFYNWDQHEFDLSRYSDRGRPDSRHLQQRNTKELLKLINLCFEHYSRLLVVRVDLHYRQEISPLIPIELAQWHRHKLLADRRQYPDVFAHLVGYAWGFEYGQNGGGFHFHLLALYDGAHRRDDVGLGMAIRDLWTEITQGAGACYISNFDKGKLAEMGVLGIGMIHRSDVEKRVNLIERVAPYITKNCFDLDAQSLSTQSGNFRTFGKSAMPAPLPPGQVRRGRPRQR